MNTRHYDVISLTALASSLVGGVLLGERLPERVATHFDLHGNVNGWMPRNAAIVILPALGVVFWCFQRFAPRFLPRTERARLGPATAPLVAAMTSVFLAVVHLGLLAHALHPRFSVGRLAYLGAGGLFIALGLVLPRVRRNALIGVRTAWTLASDENWARTHRVAGYTMVLGGAASALFGMLGGAVGGVGAIISLFLSGVVPAAYSLVLARHTDAS